MDHMFTLETKDGKRRCDLLAVSQFMRWWCTAGDNFLGAPDGKGGYIEDKKLVMLTDVDEVSIAALFADVANLKPGDTGNGEAILDEKIDFTWTYGGKPVDLELICFTGDSPTREPMGLRLLPNRTWLKEEAAERIFGAHEGFYSYGPQKQVYFVKPGGFPIGTIYDFDHFNPKKGDRGRGVGKDGIEFTWLVP